MVTILEEILDTDLNQIPFMVSGNLTSHTRGELPNIGPPPLSKVLDAYSVNLNELAETGEFDHIAPNGTYVEQIEEILCRKVKCSAMLVGDSGVGKTALVEYLSSRISKLKTNDYLINKKILALDLFSMIAGTKYRGQFEERLKAFIDVIKKDKNNI